MVQRCGGKVYKEVPLENHELFTIDWGEFDALMPAAKAAIEAEVQRYADNLPGTWKFTNPQVRGFHLVQMRMVDGQPASFAQGFEWPRGFTLVGYRHQTDL